MFFYIKYIWFCFKLMFSLHHYKEFLEYDPKRGKKYVLESRKLKEKIRASIRRQETPKMTHAFLMMFYDTVSAGTVEQFRIEMEAVFSLSFMWYYKAGELVESDEDSKMRE